MGKLTVTKTFALPKLIDPFTELLAPVTPTPPPKKKRSNYTNEIQKYSPLLWTPNLIRLSELGYIEIVKMEFLEW